MTRCQKSVRKTSAVHCIVCKDEEFSMPRATCYGGNIIAIGGNDPHLTKTKQKRNFVFCAKTIFLSDSNKILLTESP